VRTRYIPPKMLVMLNIRVVMAISNCITLSSLKKQQEKSTLTSYATEIVVPTPIIGD